MNGALTRRLIGTVAGLAAVGVGAFTYAAYRRAIRAARARIESGSEVAATRCGRIEYALAGQGLRSGTRSWRAAGQEGVARHRDVALRLPAHASASRWLSRGSGRRACVFARGAWDRASSRHRCFRGCAVRDAIRVAISGTVLRADPACARRLRAAPGWCGGGDPTDGVAADVGQASA